MPRFFNSSSETSAPTADGGNPPLHGQQLSLLASVMQILVKKRQKVKKSIPATLQSGMSETGFSEGGGALLSMALQGCFALVFILSSSLFPFLLQTVANMAWKYYKTKSLTGSHRHVPKSYISQFYSESPKPKGIVLSLLKINK